MDKNKVIESLKFVKENSKKRKFKQGVDIILNLRDIDLKKTDQQVDTFAALHYEKGKPAKVCGLVGGELIEQAKKVFENAISADDFATVAKDKKALKKLADEYDYFVAQANIMPQVAASFGKVLGPKGKMPNPKAGCVVPPNANLQALSEKLHKTVRITAKTTPVIQIGVGNEEMPDDQVADNIVTIYNTLVQRLPSESNNIRTIFLKLTMGSTFKIDDKGNLVKEDKKEEKK